MISERLKTLVLMAPSCNTAADIGTDHGFVPIWLIRENKASHVIASDLRRGPLETASAHIAEAGLTDRIETRLGSGLKVLKPEEADLIILAGMGGKLISALLSACPDVVSAASYLLLSPHRDVSDVRGTVEALSFSIDREEMVEEEGKFYPIILAVNRPPERPGTDLEQKYGPCFLREKPEPFLRFLASEAKKKQAVLNKLEHGRSNQRSESKRSLIKAELDEIVSLLPADRW